jgi:hypothetical protein
MDKNSENSEKRSKNQANVGLPTFAHQDVITYTHTHTHTKYVLLT